MIAQYRPEIARAVETTVLNLKTLESRIETLKNDLAALATVIGHPEAARIAIQPVSPFAGLGVGSPFAGYGTMGLGQQGFGPQGLGQHGFPPQGLVQQGFGLQGLGQQGFGLQGLGQQGFGQVGSPFQTPFPGTPNVQGLGVGGMGMGTNPWSQVGVGGMGPTQSPWLQQQGIGGIGQGVQGVPGVQGTGNVPPWLLYR